MVLNNTELKKEQKFYFYQKFWERWEKKWQGWIHAVVFNKRRQFYITERTKPHELGNSLAGTLQKILRAEVAELARCLALSLSWGWCVRKVTQQTCLSVNSPHCHTHMALHGALVHVQSLLYALGRWRFENLSLVLVKVMSFCILVLWLSVSFCMFVLVQPLAPSISLWGREELAGEWGKDRERKRELNWDWKRKIERERERCV